jgi:hypothetical protein
MQTYDEIRGNIKTGDIVLFGGKGGISEWIKWFSRSKWSHVGMAVRSDEWNMLLIWESTTLNSVKDVELNRSIRGVQLVPFSERVKNYKGDIGVRHLSKPVTDLMQIKLRDFRHKVAGRPYERNYIELIKAAYDGPFGGNVENLSSLFCSELVAEAYQQIGLLDDGRGSLPSNEYTPKDFSTEAKEPLDLLNDYSLSNEILIKR